MTIEQIISYVGTLGIGGLLGVILKSWFDYRMNKEKILFEARTKAYAGITDRIFNLFLEPDITMLKDNALIWAKITSLLSDVVLLGSPELTDLLGDFKLKVCEFHKQLDEKNDKESERIHKELVKLVTEIHTQMRKDLFIGIKAKHNAGSVKEFD